jgi:phage-related protein
MLYLSVYKIILLEPAIEFIDTVNKKMKAKIYRTVDLLEKYGPFLPLPHSKKLSGHNLYELRVKVASDIVRLFYFHDKGKIFVITSGYVKKTNKTSMREINFALKLKYKFQEDLNEKR